MTVNNTMRLDYAQMDTPSQAADNPRRLSGLVISDRLTLAKQAHLWQKVAETS